MSKIRVACYIDGFNMYHAIDDANKAARGKLNHLKWVNLKLLMLEFTDINVHEINSVKFFTAYPTWKKDSLERHHQYVAAQKYYGSDVILGRFKKKEAYCKICGSTYKAREEKESDVNIATHLVGDAHNHIYDHAFLVTNDSDLLGPVRHVRNSFPKKKIKVISPPFRSHSKELWAAATNSAKISKLHLERSIMPKTALDQEGNTVFTRPANYTPPIGN
jgi:uncharacterized LabA/DUF88 family protein